MKSFGSRFGGIWPRKKAIIALTILCMFSVVSGCWINAEQIVKIEEKMLFGPSISSFAGSMSGFAVKLERLVFTGVLGSGGETEDIFGSGREEKINPPKKILIKISILRITNQVHQ